MKQTFYIAILLLIATGCSKKKKDWFLIEKLDSQTYIISEPHSSQGNSSFLIIGDKEAILFDSGTGENGGKSILKVAESLTKQPITLLLSHFHFDHIGCLSDFNKVAIPDLQPLKNKLSGDSLLSLSSREILSGDTLTIQVSRIYQVQKEIDLGNRKIIILHTPGHSKESISIIDSDNGYIFTGDLIYNGLLLIEDCNAYNRSISEILKNSDTNYRVFGAHSKPEVGYKHLYQVKMAIGSYLAGDYSLESVHQIIFFGVAKDVYKIENISFIVGYADVFSNEEGDATIQAKKKTP